MAVDDRLRLLRWDLPDTPDGFLQGWYYIVRFNDDGSIAAWQVHHADQWCEPTSAHIEVFKRGDTWTNPDEFRKRRARNQYEQEAKSRQLREEAQWKLKENADFLFRVQIPVSKKVA